MGASSCDDVDDIDSNGDVTFDVEGDVRGDGSHGLVRISDRSFGVRGSHDARSDDVITSSSHLSRSFCVTSSSASHIDETIRNVIRGALFASMTSSVCVAIDLHFRFARERFDLRARGSDVEKMSRSFMTSRVGGD